MLEVGFTGTQEELSEEQFESLRKLLTILRIGRSRPSLGILDRSPFEGLHHGDCVGADRTAHRIASELHYYISIHPPLNPVKRAWCKIEKDGGKYCLAKDYIPRNYDIVDETQALIGCPRTEVEELRSGTWSTIRYARKLKRPIFLIMPDGKVVMERRVEGYRFAV
jgi:hypothetical protein